MLDFSAIRVLVVGDVMLDRYLYGDAERISPEAPVPVVRLRETRAMLGGAGNVARNITALGGQAVLVGLLGDDPAAAEVEALLDADLGIINATRRVPGRPTVCKNRIVAGQQQVVRLDDESAAPTGAADAAGLAGCIALHIADCGAVVLSDYAKGVMAPTVIETALRLAAARGLPVLVDPKGEDFARYRGATCITPNQRELAAAARLPIGTEAEVVAAARQVMAEAGLGAVLVTRSERGMVLVEPDAVHAVPAQAREVFDVSGAGDTVIATLALAHAAGRPLAAAMPLANAAAGIVVGKLGTATVGAAELERALHDAAEPGPDGRALLERGEAERRVAEWRRQGLRVGLTNGCFDILHAGHVALLRAARERCDRLVVALNDDASVARLKGPERPINPLRDRGAVIAALAAVDAVVAFEEDTPFELIRALRPDVLVKGGDYTHATVVGADLVREAGGEVVIVALLPGRSTTGLVARLRAP